MEFKIGKIMMIGILATNRDMKWGKSGVPSHPTTTFSDVILLTTILERDVGDGT
jgi:hypothetical protein